MSVFRAILGQTQNEAATIIPQEVLDAVAVRGQIPIVFLFLAAIYISVLVWSVSRASYLGVFLPFTGDEHCDKKVLQSYKNIQNGLREVDGFTSCKLVTVKELGVTDAGKVRVVVGNEELSCGPNLIVLQKKNPDHPFHQRQEWSEEMKEKMKNKLVLIEEDVGFDSKDLSILCGFVKSIAIIRDKDKRCHHPISTEDSAILDSTLSVWTRVWAVVLSALCYQCTFLEGPDSEVAWALLLVSSRIYSRTDTFKRLLIRNRLRNPAEVNTNLEQSGILFSAFADGLFLAGSALLAILMYLARDGFRVPILRSLVAAPVGAFVIYDVLSLAADMEETNRPAIVFWIASFVSAVCWGMGTILFHDWDVFFKLLIPAVVFPFAGHRLTSTILSIQDARELLLSASWAWTMVHILVLLYLSCDNLCTYFNGGAECALKLWPSLVNTNNITKPIVPCDNDRNNKDGGECWQIRWWWIIWSLVCSVMPCILLYQSTIKVTKMFSPHQRWIPPSLIESKYFGHLNKTRAISPVVLTKRKQLQSFHLEGGALTSTPENNGFPVDRYSGTSDRLQWSR